MENTRGRDFAATAILAATIILAAVMTYSIYERARPTGFSLLYFEPGALQNGEYVAVLENHEGAPQQYTVEFYADGKRGDVVEVNANSGQNYSYGVLEHAPGFARENSTVEVRALRPQKPALSIYATRRANK